MTKPLKLQVAQSIILEIYAKSPKPQIEPVDYVAMIKTEALKPPLISHKIMIQNGFLN
jgi:hypothetical protein